MKAIRFTGVNKTYGENQPQYIPLPVMKFPDGMMISCWELTDEEVEEIVKNKKLYISMMTFNHPLQPHRPAAHLSDLVETKEE